MDILYKYITSQRALTCIPEVGDGTLRATQPAALNDPFECAVVPAYATPDEEKENRALAEVLTQINSDKPVSEEAVCQARRDYGSLFTRQLPTKQLSTRFGIISFTTNFCHPLMWSHYTTDGSGYVIGYDVAELKKLTNPEDYLRHDVLRDEGEVYAGRLQKAGVLTDVQRFAGQIHGFFSLLTLPDSDLDFQ